METPKKTNALNDATPEVKDALEILGKEFDLKKLKRGVLPKVFEFLYYRCKVTHRKKFVEKLAKGNYKCADDFSKKYEAFKEKQKYKVILSRME